VKVFATLKRWLSDAPPPAANDGNRAAVAAMVYARLYEARGTLGIALVRPPNPEYEDTVAVLFDDGRDVIIRFEEVRS
jgi:hypothetical protein